MEYIISRGYDLPESINEMNSGLWYNLWNNKNWPYSEILDGDSLYWYETKKEKITWRTKIKYIHRFTYKNKEEAAINLSKLSKAFSSTEQYFKNASAKGYAICYFLKDSEKVNIPKPTGYKFPRLGWERINEDIQILWNISPASGSIKNKQNIDEVTLDDISDRVSLFEQLQQINDKMKDIKPERVTNIINSTIRKDREIIQKLKEHFNYQCQYPNCNAYIPMKNGGNYIEVAHIKPVSKGGQSMIGNLLVLCPNHHKEFDYGNLTIEEQTIYSIRGILNDKQFEITF